MREKDVIPTQAGIQILVAQAARLLVIPEGLNVNSRG